MPTQKDTPNKNFKFGLELEFFTLNQQGYMINEATRLIKAIQAYDPKIDVKQECGKNMIEFGFLPDTGVQNVIGGVVNDLEKVLYVAEKEKIILYPYSTYPAAFIPEFQPQPLYKVKEEIFGKKRWHIAAQVVGMHCHYTLPWGVFDEKNKTIKQLVNSKNKESLLNIYNLYIAMDPVLTLFTQSSPFFQGKSLGKDSRVIAYRGGEALNYPDGLYTNYERYGSLQRYEETITDLLHVIETRHAGWSKIVKNLSVKSRTLSKHNSILDTAWNPVKVNAHGTLEQRGMDINSPTVIIAIALIIKYMSMMVTQDYMHVVPSDVAISRPFKKEENTLYIPPHSYVRYVLQPKSAYEGMASNEVYEYAKSFFSLVKSFIPENRHFLLNPIETMLKERKTASDRIIETAKKLKITLYNGISAQEGAKLALALSTDIYKEVVLLKQTLATIND
jgi:hypothetical protein